MHIYLRAPSYNQRREGKNEAGWDYKLNLFPFNRRT